jgi:hypothetical protein
MYSEKRQINFMLPQDPARAALNKKTLRCWPGVKPDQACPEVNSQNTHIQKEPSEVWNNDTVDSEL